MSLRTADFDYELPGELIAQTPLPRRDSSRLMVLDRRTGEITHSRVSSLPAILQPGDVLVANNSRVLAARLLARRSPTGGKVEILLLERLDSSIWRALVKPARRLMIGEVLTSESPGPAPDQSGKIKLIDRSNDGIAILEIPSSISDHLDLYGSTPLPPYITEHLSDPERYQTIYASVPGSAAAPTAGLHFTSELIRQLIDAGIGWAEITLHIGLDTFRPVTVDTVQNHTIHTERCEVSETVACRIANAKASGGRIIAVGTTAARTLETAGRFWQGRCPFGFSTATDIFITPGHSWTVVDGLLTNFHLPRSTLIMMVSALAGLDHILAAYRAAIEQRYRFYSFGDAMLIL